jgi:hypothetical protein
MSEPRSAAFSWSIASSAARARRRVGAGAEALRQPSPIAILIGASEIASAGGRC